MAVTATAELVSTFAGDPDRPPDHNGWNNPAGDPDWIPDIDWYRRVQLECKGDAGEVINIVNWECYDGTIQFKTTAEIKADTDGTFGVFVNNSETWTLWAFGGVSYYDTKTSCVCTHRANGARVQVVLGPAKKPEDDNTVWTVAAFLPGSGRTPAATADLEVGFQPPAPPEPESVTVVPATASVAVAGTTALTATVAPPEAPQTVVWTSSAPAVATVSNGTVTGVAAGTATITATAGTVSDTCAVTVTSVEREAEEPKRGRKRS